MTQVDVEDLFAKLKPVLGEQIDSLWWEYRLNPESRRDIEGILHSLAVKHLGHGIDNKQILLVPPPPEQATGEYQLGQVWYADKAVGLFGLREQEWIQHAAVFGRTGSGKTNVGFLILRELCRKGKPFLIFDWKRNYRDLLALPEFQGIRAFTVGRSVAPFAFNPLAPPPGTQPAVWLKKLIEIMCHVYWLGEGVAYLLQKAIDEVYRQAGVYQGSSAYPVLADVKNWLLAYKAKGREAGWMDSTLRAVGTLCYGEVGRVLNSIAATPIDDLLKERVVLELDALTNSDKAFLIESLILWIHHFRLQEAQRETFKHATVIEEAHHVLLKRKQSRETVMDVVFREIRELGEALILIDQHPSLVSLPSLGNTYCTIAMNLKHGSDIRAIGDAMLLNEEQRDYLGRLDVGQGIVRLQGRWHQPFLVRFPLLQVAKGSVTDEALASKIGTFSGHSGHILPRERPKGEIQVVRAADKTGESQYKLGSEEEALLRDVMEHPTSGVWERFGRLGVSVGRGYKVLSCLFSSQLLADAPVSSPWGRVRFLYPTKVGEDVLRQMGYDCLGAKNESPEHRFWKHKVAEVLRDQGYDVQVEAPLGGSIVDIFANKEGETLAVEVETGRSDLAGKVSTSQSLPADRVVLLVLTRNAADRLKALTTGARPVDHRLAVQTVKEFLEQFGATLWSYRPFAPRVRQ